MKGRRWFWGAAAFCVVAVVALEVWGPANYWAGLIPETKRGETDGLRWRALIIGVDEFPNLPTKAANASAVAKKRKRPSDEFALTSCASDANAFADALVKYAGFKRKDVCVLTFKKGDALDLPNAPTAENIRRRVREFCEKSTENDALLVYFSGHGVMLDANVGGAEKESRSYLCACDADLGERASFVDRKALFDVLKSASAKRKIFIADCCREPIRLWSAADGAEAEVWTAVKKFGAFEYGDYDVAQLSSCRERQFSFENGAGGGGYFTTSLIEALEEGADERGELSLLAWFDFAQKRTMERSTAWLKMKPTAGYLDEASGRRQTVQEPTIYLGGETGRWMFARNLPVDGLALDVWKRADALYDEAKKRREEAQAEEGDNDAVNERALAKLTEARKALEQALASTVEANESAARRLAYRVELAAVERATARIVSARQGERRDEAKALAEEAAKAFVEKNYDAAAAKMRASLEAFDSATARVMLATCERARAERKRKVYAADGTRLNGRFFDVSPRKNADEKVETLTTNAATLAKPTGRKAFLVGADDYACKHILCETAARKDVEALKARLLEIGFKEEDVVILKTGGDFADYPTRANIRRRFQEFLDGLKVGDLAFVYWDGHGFQTSETADAYFAPIDVEAEEEAEPDFERRLAETAILVDDASDALERSAATFRCFVVDACRAVPSRLTNYSSAYDEAMSELAAKVVWEDSAFLIEYDVATQDFGDLPPTVARLNACAPGGKGYEVEKREEGKEEEILGTMARSWLEALDPNDAKADFNRDGVVAFSEAAQYVAARTNEWAKEIGEEQTPTLSGAIVDFALATGVKRKGGKPAETSDASEVDGNAEQKGSVSK